MGAISLTVRPLPIFYPFSPLASRLTPPEESAGRAREAGGARGGKVVDCGAEWSKVGDYNLGEGGLVPHVSWYLRAPTR